MGFWTSTGNEAVEPKRKFRFKVTFGDSDSGLGVAWYAKTVNKPTFTVNAAEHKYLNYVFYYPGNVTWNEITIALVDPADPDIATSLAKVLGDAGYSLPGNAGATSKTISKAKSITALSSVVISQLGADGAVVEEWTLHNAWIREVKFGDLEYGADDLSQVDIMMRYDWATLTQKGGGKAPEYFGTHTSTK